MLDQLFKLVTIVIGCSFIIACNPDKKKVIGDLVIKDGTIIDGTGAEKYIADIVIKDDAIVWIGKSEDQDILVDSAIVATDKIISPGFIDLHAHGEPLETPNFENFLAMGVTTIALGMDGSSKKSGDMIKWMEQVSTKGIGVNILPFIGHGTIRTESGIGVSTEINNASLKIMTDLVDTSLASGCWGLSMGLEYMPGYHAEARELRELAKVVGKYDALITSHIRNEDDDKIDNSIDEMISLAEYCNVNISHIKVVYGKGKDRAKEIINKLENPNGANHNITADLYPYSASFTGIGIVFPDWAKVPTKYAEIKEQRGEELLAFLHNKIIQRNGPKATLFGTGPYAGKTLQDLVDEYNRPYDIILRDIIGPYGASAAYFVMNDELQTELLNSSVVMVGSDGSPTMRHPRGYGTFSKVIEEYVVKDKTFTLEEAIHKMSGLPANTIGLEDRGVIKVGAKADLLIFDPSSIHSNATFENPHQYASGMDMVIINGDLAWQEESHLENHGLVIKRK